MDKYIHVHAYVRIPTYQTCRQTNRRKDGQINSQTERETERQRDRETERQRDRETDRPVSYTHLRAHETEADLVCRLLLEKKKTQKLFLRAH